MKTAREARSRRSCCRRRCPSRSSSRASASSCGRRWRRRSTCARSGTQFIDAARGGADGPSARYRAQLNREGSPSELVAAGISVGARHRAGHAGPATGMTSGARGGCDENQRPAPSQRTMDDNRTGIAHLADRRARRSIDGAARRHVRQRQLDADPVIAERGCAGREQVAPGGDDAAARDVQGRWSRPRRGDAQGKKRERCSSTCSASGWRSSAPARASTRRCSRSSRPLHGPGGPTRADIERIRDEELQHFVLLKDAIESLGGDPTAMTPERGRHRDRGVGLGAGARRSAHHADARRSRRCSSAELTDNDAWLTLVGPGEGLGLDELAESFRQALQEEDEHLTRVRTWIAVALSGQAGVELPAVAADEDTGPGIPAP